MIGPALAALMGVLAILVLLAPVLRRSATTGLTRAESAEAVLRDKLSQLRRDEAAGLIGAEEARAAEAEVGRALIVTAREARGQAASTARGHVGGYVAIALSALVLGTGVYGAKGSWKHLDDDVARSVGTDVDAAPTLLGQHEGGVVSDAIASLRQRLSTDPENAENWLLLARSLSTIGDYPGAAEAYARLVALQPLDIEIRGDLGEALVRAQDGFVGPAAVDAFEVVLAHVPEDPRALYYLALRDAQAGDSMTAAAGWARILRTAPPDAPYRPAISQILEAIIADAGLDRAELDIPEPIVASGPLTEQLEAPAASGPGAAQVAAAAEMPADAQIEMIRGMVQRLEERLEEEPTDVDGWLRLIRSRMVLGEPDAARDALARALKANPDAPELAEAHDTVQAGARP